MFLCVDNCLLNYLDLFDVEYTKFIYFELVLFSTYILNDINENIAKNNKLELELPTFLLIVISTITNE